jgi:biopolymer transport protein ExbD
VRLSHRYRRKRARIEMVPLIDIVFLLLVFFIYAMLTMAVHKGMNVDLPESVETEQTEESPLVVSVAVRQGQPVVYLDRTEVSLPELEKGLRSLGPGRRQQAEVQLFADQAVSYQQLYRVLDRISAAGIASVSLQADQKR